MIFDHEARKHSYELLAKAFGKELAIPDKSRPAQP
jgi:hypothetical protein